MKIRYFPKRGVIWLDFKDGAGERRRVPTTATTQHEAEKQAPAIVARILSNSSTSGTAPEGRQKAVVGTIVRPTGMTLREAFDQAHRERWLKSKDLTSKKTDFKGLLLSNGKLTEDMDCAVMTQELMTELRAWWTTQPGLRAGTKLSNSTINHRLTIASILLETAKGQPHLVKHLSTKGNRRKRRVREEELQAVVSWCIANHHRKGAIIMADLVVFGMHSTNRLGDLLSLKWADVYLDKNMTVFRDPKNGQSHTGHLTPVAKNILERRFACGGDGPFTDLGKPQAEALWRSARAAMGLEHDHEFVFHVATRHEGLSRLGENGATAFEMKAFSGHQSIVAMDRYVKPSVESLERVGKFLVHTPGTQSTSGTNPDAERLH